MRLTLADYWLDIYGRKRTVLVVAGSAAAIAFGASLVMTPLYESRTVFYSPANVVVPDYTNTGTAPALAQAPYVPAADEKSASIGIGILRSRNVFEALNKEFPERSVNDILGQTDIKVSREFMIEVYVRDPDPDRAAAIARRFPELYRSFNADNIRGEMLKVQSSALRQADAAERRMAELRGIGRNGADDAAVRQAEDRAEAAAKALATADVTAVDALFDGSFEPITRQLERVSDEAAGKDAPQARRTLDEILKRSTAALAPQDAPRADALMAYAALRADVAIAKARASAAATTIPPGAPQWQGSRDVDLQQTAARLRAVAAEAGAQAAEPSSPVVVVQSATMPTRAVFPITILNTVVAGLTGLALGCYFALFCGLIERVGLARVKKGMERPALSTGTVAMLRNIRERRS